MAKLRKTLPKDFQELLEAGALEQLKTALMKCEPEAYDGWYKNTALFYRHLPDDLVCWLVERGANINYRNRYEETPLHAQARQGSDNLALFIQLGAQVNARTKHNKDTPLHEAARNFHPQAVKTLLANGADQDAKNDQDENPLELMLVQLMSAVLVFFIDKSQQEPSEEKPPQRMSDEIAQAVDIARIFINAEVSVSDKIRRSVAGVGGYLELYKNGLDPNFLREAENGLNCIYELIGVQPEPPVERIDMASTTSPVQCDGGPSPTALKNGK